jgi:hypothetical protein
LKQPSLFRHAISYTRKVLYSIDTPARRFKTNLREIVDVGDSDDALKVSRQKLLINARV